jgi:uncharacterized protein YlzI (FlbEa/FlbD family)
MARYSLRVWANVRAQYETGSFTIDELQKLFGISRNTIQFQCIKNGWVKGKTAPTVAYRINESTLDCFIRLGMPPEKVNQRVLEGIESSTDTIIKIADRLKEIQAEATTEEVLKKISSIIKDLAEFKRISLLYIQEYNKMIGNYAPTKSEVTVHPLIPDNLSRDELYNRIAAMIGGKIHEAEPVETAENAVFEDIADKKIDDI